MKKKPPVRQRREGKQQEPLHRPGADDGTPYGDLKPIKTIPLPKVRAEGKGRVGTPKDKR